MESLNRIQVIFIPTWVRLVLFLIVFGSLAVAAWVFAQGLESEAGPQLVAAALSLASVVFPILVIYVLFAGSSFDERAITDRTDRLLRATLPMIFRQLPETTGGFGLYNGLRVAGETARADAATVRVRHLPGRCYADYAIAFPGDADEMIEVRLRVEVNIRRVNVVFLFDERKVRENVGAAPGVAPEEVDVKGVLFDLFRHSEEAVEKHALSSVQADVEAKAKSPLVYFFNDEMLPMKDGDATYLGMVATASVSSDMVWNAAERLYFAQDLMLMVRSFVRFGRPVFATPAAAPATAAAGGDAPAAP